MKFKDLNYNISGDGDVILLLHGWGGNINSLQLFTDVLNKTNKCINFDLYGFGKSNNCNKNFDTYEYAIQIYLFLKSKNINEVSIICHSFGGRIAILLSTIFNIVIKKLVLISVAGLKYKFSFSKKIKQLEFKIVKYFVKHNIVNEKELLKYGSDDYRILNDEMKQVFIKVTNQTLNYLLNKITSETLIVWGDKDKTTPLYFANILHKKIKNSIKYVYKNSSHFCYLENRNSCLYLVKYFINN